jgi:hypothetical protein
MLTATKFKDNQTAKFKGRDKCEMRFSHTNIKENPMRE